MNETNIETRNIVPGTPLRAGDVVYRVVEYDPPDENTPHTWKVASAVIERASDKQIKLKSQPPGFPRILFQPDALGRAFFESPLQAVKAFLKEQQAQIESLERQRKTAERAVTWATSEINTNVTDDE